MKKLLLALLMLGLPFSTYGACYQLVDLESGRTLYASYEPPGDISMYPMSSWLNQNHHKRKQLIISLNRHCDWGWYTYNDNADKEVISSKVNDGVSASKAQTATAELEKRKAISRDRQIQNFLSQRKHLGKY